MLPMERDHLVHFLALCGISTPALPFPESFNPSFQHLPWQLWHFQTSFSLGHYFFHASKSHPSNELVCTVSWCPYHGVQSCISGECPQINKLSLLQSSVLAPLIIHPQNSAPHGFSGSCQYMLAVFVGPVEYSPFLALPSTAHPCDLSLIISLVSRREGGADPEGCIFCLAEKRPLDCL